MRRCALLLLLTTLVPTGCALLRPAGPSPEDRFERGLAELAQQNYPAAAESLRHVYNYDRDRDDARRALLALAAAEMDPRNPYRQLDAGAGYAAIYLRLPERDASLEPTAETLYLLSLELGATLEQTQALKVEAGQAHAEAHQAKAEAHKAQAEAQQAKAEAQQAHAQAAAAQQEANQAQAASRAPRPLPQLPGPPVTARIRELTGERDKLAARIDDLEAELAKVKKESAAKSREIERIRKTLKP